MKRLQISIPKPCHEDWNQMTSEERGRFCSLCKKTVLDFSTQTHEEILEFIQSHRNENLCGRFTSDQLAQFSRIELPLPVYRLQMSFVNAFLVALLFCFGTSLFSCNIPATSTLGKIEAAYSETSAENIADTNKLMVLGNIESAPAEFVSDERGFRKGEVSIVPDTIDLPAVEVADSAVLWDKNMIVGALAVEVVYDEGYPSLFDEADTIAEKGIAPYNEENFFTSVYPNPSTGLVNIELKFAEEQYMQMDLYDLSGRLVRPLLSNELQQPELKTLQVDISDQPPGIYFLRISAGDKVKTERIVIANK